MSLNISIPYDNLNDPVIELARFRSGLEECEEHLCKSYNKLTNRDIHLLIRSAIHMKSMLETITESYKAYKDFEQRALPHVECILHTYRNDALRFFTQIADKANDFNIWDMLDYSGTKSVSILFNSDRLVIEEYPLDIIQKYFKDIYSIIDRVDWIIDNRIELENKIIGFTGESSADEFQIRFLDDRDEIANIASENPCWYGIWDSKNMQMIFTGYSISITRGGVSIGQRIEYLCAEICLSRSWLKDYIDDYIPELKI